MIQIQNFKQNRFGHLVLVIGITLKYLSKSPQPPFTKGKV